MTPEVNVINNTSNQQDILSVPAHVHYVLMEILKNSMRAMIESIGILEMEDSEKVINIVLSTKGKYACITITDQGDGFSPHTKEHLFNFYSTSSKKRPEPNYNYSREFGAPFTGI